ncbi:uncharacterized protein PHACADRAFT_246368 [Phanerochaete carnosa HHB-10118-sp]|uniref:RlpA-like protein double-psi beta-barrel domain-containing protein n=1 Tax=Phanerochaete carnosa (strain HHB-10118-sp) TaxID=650164 RepID=K5WLY1_PHACS|nr:uncharacterized protein PHACADRAFT_246368 [Phanerochaete carnosa HHB-10118-sp]EKM60430.1 hypothetical protein PHACADRAFT_246368 [Phanerochaete carnosa HHB-10118-sp]
MQLSLFALLAATSFVMARAAAPTVPVNDCPAVPACFLNGTITTRSGHDIPAEEVITPCDTCPGTECGEPTEGTIDYDDGSFTGDYSVRALSCSSLHAVFC